MALVIVGYTTTEGSAGNYVPLGASTPSRRLYISPNNDIFISFNSLGTNAIRLAGGALARYDLGVTDPSTLFVRAQGASATQVSVFTLDAGES